MVGTNFKRETSILRPPGLLSNGEYDSHYNIFFLLCESCRVVEKKPIWDVTARVNFFFAATRSVEKLFMTVAIATL